MPLRKLTCLAILPPEPGVRHGRDCGLPLTNIEPDVVQCERGHKQRILVSDRGMEAFARRDR